MKKILAVVLLCFIASCSSQKTEKKISLPTILVTVAPYAYFVEKIAGESLEIQILIPPATNAHTYEPTLSQVQNVSQAQVWFTIGDPIEKKIYRTLKEKNPSLLKVKLNEGIPLLSLSQDSMELAACESHHAHEHGEEGKDIHVWLSPKYAKLQAELIFQTLIHLFPQNAAIYRENFTNLQNELDALDDEIRNLLEPWKQSAILVSHPAFGYFCNEYGLLQLSIECEGKEPRPKDITYILQRANALHVHVVLLQEGYSNKGAELIGEKLKLPIFQVDPYSRDYSNNLRHIAEIINDHRN